MSQLKPFHDVAKLCSSEAERMVLAMMYEAPGREFREDELELVLRALARFLGRELGEVGKV